MKRILFGAVLLFALTAPSASQQPLAVITSAPVKTAPVCDTKELAQQYIELSNSNSDADVFEKINAGKPKPVCGILTVQFIPEAVEVERLRMRHESVSIIRIRLLAAQLPDLSFVSISGGMTLYIILSPRAPT